METGKTFPAFRVFQANLFPQLCHIMFVPGTKSIIIGRIFGPQFGKSFSVFMKHSIGWKHFRINPRFSFFVQIRSEFLVTVHHRGNIIQHCRIQFPVFFFYPGDIQFYSHAVSAGNICKIMFKIFFPASCSHVDFFKQHFTHSFFLRIFSTGI